jgi:transposase-like protein
MRKRFSDEFKARVALEAIKEEKTLAQLSSEFGVHANLIGRWKKELKEGMVKVFSERQGGVAEKEKEALIERLYKNIGQLQVENDWLKKKLGLCR